MYCKKCGKEIASDAEYCSYCGIRVGKSQEENALGDEDAQKKKSVFPVKTVVAITILLLTAAVVATKILEAPDGSFNKKFAISNIDPSLEATDNDFIQIPMITEHTEYGINASSYEEHGGFGGIRPESDFIRGVSSVMTITFAEDNTFGMNYYDHSVYGDYYFDKEASSVLFYVDDNEYWGKYDGRKDIEMWSDDGSRFVFKEVWDE